MAGRDGGRRELMAGQHAVWSAQQLSPDDPINVGGCLEIHGDLDLDLFERALRRTVSEAEAFHLRFSGEGESLRQAVAKSDDWPLHLIDVSGAPDPLAAAESWMRSDIRRPVGMRNGPLFTHAVFKAGQARFLWYQRGHHIAIDGAATRIIAARVGEVYNALLAGQLPAAAALEPLSTLIDADHAYRASPDFARDRQYWLDALLDLAVPANIASSMLPGCIPVRHTEDVQPRTVADLRMTANRLGVTFDELMVLVAALYLHRNTKAEDVVVGRWAPGRIGEQLCAIPGMTANILPVRAAINRRTTVGELALETSRLARDAVRHQRYRYSDIRADLGLPDDQPLFDLTVDVIPSGDVVRFGDCVAITHGLARGNVGSLLIEVRKQAQDGGIQLAFSANSDQHSVESVRGIAHHVMDILRWMANASPADYASRTRGAWPVTVVGLFGEQVARVPDAVAVVGGGVWLSYAALDAAARGVAGVLAARGVGPESVVGVVAERSVGLVVAVLGVLKAGAAYLPVDAGYPAQRAGLMLADAGAVVVVTDRACAGVVPAGGPPRVVLEDVRSGLAGGGAGAAVSVLPGHAAYVMYTSGSTGRPKGVVVTHRGLACYVASVAGRAGWAVWAAAVGGD